MQVLTRYGSTDFFYAREINLFSVRILNRQRVGFSLSENKFYSIPE